jgi:hypothetical protein
VCTSAGCGVACDDGWDDCDTNASTGCEVNLATTPAHCGACNQACPSRPNANAACTSSQCGFTCKTGYEDCDDVVSTGCEINLTNDKDNCGACGTKCGTANGTASCTNSACSIVCTPGFANCDNVNSTGCEVNVNTSLIHCGSCGNACGTANGTASCSTGTCQIACANGYANCDGNHLNGCEKNLLTDPANCGVCGRSCGTDSTCSAGFCVPKEVVKGLSFTLDFENGHSALYYVSAPVPPSIVTGISKIELGNNTIKGLVAKVQPPSLWVAEGAVFYPLSADIRSVPTSGGTAQVEVADAGTSPRGIQFYGQRIWWVAGDSVGSAPRGGSWQQLATVGNDVDEFQIDNTYVYWAEPASGKVQRVNRSSKAVTALATSQNQPRDVALSGQNLFWINQGDGTVRRVAVTGGSSTTLVSGQSSPNSIAAWPGYVYWTTGDGGVWRATDNGASALKLAQGQSSPTKIALHSGYVYWVTSDKKIMRVAW